MIAIPIILAVLVLLVVLRRRRKVARVKATTWGMSEALDIAAAVARRDRWKPRKHRRYGLWP